MDVPSPCVCIFQKKREYVVTFRNLSIGHRLGLGFALVLLALTVSTGVGIYRLQTVADATHTLMSVPLAKERMISDWQRYLYGGIRRTTAIAKSSDASLAGFFAADADSSTKKSLVLVKKIEELADSEEEKALLENINHIRTVFTDARDQVSAAKKAGDQDTAKRSLEEDYLPAAQAYEDAVQKLLDHQRHAIDMAAQHVDEIASTSRAALILLAILAIGLGVVCAWLLTKSITLPVGRAVAAARRIADGDLSDGGALVRNGERTRDEAAILLDALRLMNENLAHIVSQVRGGTDAIASASTEIAAGNHDLSARTEAQAASLEETAASMSELTATIRQNLENARQADQIGTHAVGTVEKGSTAVEHLVATVNKISDSSARIADIITLIEGIAFQTNILALNAAVEAARAGEQGRGFAVVASEVRSLAQRSSAAAKEIKELIEASVESVREGVQRADEVGQNMVAVKRAIRRVADLVAEITAASEEQTRGVEQVDAAVSQMDQVTQQNAALVEQAAAAAQSMDDQAGQLKASVAVFKLADVCAYPVS